MSVQAIEGVICPHCHDTVDAADKFCGRCGTSMLGESDIEKTVCPNCFNVMSVDDRFCRRCGAPTRANGAESGLVCPSNSGQTLTLPPVADRLKGLESPWFVLLMLFVVLGPLGLPLLWRSRRFSIFWKLSLTTALATVTGFIIFLMWYVAQMSLEPLRQLDQFNL